MTKKKTTINMQRMMSPLVEPVMGFGKSSY